MKLSLVDILTTKNWFSIISLFGKIEMLIYLVMLDKWWKKQYLRRWNTKENSYTYLYRETLRQQYVLRKNSGAWKIYEFIRSAPRTSIPHRKRYKN
ncbi:MAG: hypothetical protein ACYC49_07835 [Ignavibacteriaceae bacterium]